MGEARPASFSNQGCPTDYNSENIPSHHEYCCTSDYFLMVNLGSTFLVLDLSVAPKNTLYALFLHLFLHSMYLIILYIMILYNIIYNILIIFAEHIFAYHVFAHHIFTLHVFAEHIFAEHIFA